MGRYQYLYKYTNTQYYNPYEVRGSAKDLGAFNMMQRETKWASLISYYEGRGKTMTITSTIHVYYMHDISSCRTKSHGGISGPSTEYPVVTSVVAREALSPQGEGFYFGSKVPLHTITFTGPRVTPRVPVET